jgi:hypothetical protein
MESAMKLDNLIVFLAAAALSAANIASAGEIVLAENGKSAYRIVVADDASPSTKYGAQELQKFLEQISGARLPIVSDKRPAGPKEILLGDNAHFQALKTGIDVASLGKEGYAIRTVGDHLVIVGGALRGNLYGVYGLLEDHLGCRWFTPDCSRIPKMPRLVLGRLDDRRVPALEYRETNTFDCLDGDWCARNRMNSSNARLEEKHGGKVAFGDGFFVHTFFSLVPVEKYYAEHPEYFSLVKGKRIKEQTQLCCTHPDVIRLCTEAVREAMRRQPLATAFSVSQNDWDNHCECRNCQALATREDSQMAPLLQLVNRVAEAVEKEFPDKAVETLAYNWTMRPPKHIRPRPNVIIRLCSIHCCCSHPIATCDGREEGAYSEEFRNALVGWAKIAPRLWVWDYTTNFWTYLLPHPKLFTLGPNIRFFAEHNVKGVFEEGCAATADSAFAAINGYVMAKCLWNPNYDADRAINEFLVGYYGKAAKPIRAYLDLLHNHVVRENIHTTISPTTDSPHLNDALLTKADALWQQGEDLVAAEPVILRRVKISRMSVDCAIMERARLQSQKTLPASAPFMALAARRFKPFMETLMASQLAFVHLRGSPIDKIVYRRELAKDLRCNEPE